MRYGLEQLFRLEVGFVECLAAAVEKLSAGAADLEATRVIKAADAVVSGNHRLVAAVRLFVQSRNNWRDKVRSEPKKYSVNGYLPLLV